MKIRFCKCGCGLPAPIAKATNTKWGHIKGKPVNYIHGHHQRKPLPSISETEKYWLAGILEGEGSFFARTRKRNPKYSGPWVQKCPSIQICMNDKDIIAAVASLMGTSFWPRGKMYMTAVTGPRAITLMTLLEPIMGIRRQKQIRRTLTEQTPPHIWTMNNRPGTSRRPK